MVVFAGDYIYRQSACPFPNNEGEDCVGVNLPTTFSSAQADAAKLDFPPANWGDTMQGWFADFFWPARPLLAAAPWLQARGNHEICSRAGHGWHLLMSVAPFQFRARVPRRRAPAAGADRRRSGGTPGRQRGARGGSARIACHSSTSSGL